MSKRKTTAIQWCLEAMEDSGIGHLESIRQSRMEFRALLSLLRAEHALATAEHVTKHMVWTQECQALWLKARAALNACRKLGLVGKPKVRP